MDNWEKFDETTIPPKEAFYIKLNLENITDKDYERARKLWEIFGIKNRGEHHDLMLKVIHSCLQMWFKTLEVSVRKYMNLILYILCLHQD